MALFRSLANTPIIDIGVRVIVDVAEVCDEDTAENFDCLATMTCIGERPAQSLIDEYVNLQRSVVTGFVDKYVYDIKNVATGGILRLRVSKNDPKDNLRILFDRSVAFLFGTSLQNCDLEVFFENENVRFAFDDRNALDPRNPAVVRAKELLQDPDSDKLVFYAADKVFIGNFVCECLGRIPVSCTHRICPIQKTVINSFWPFLSIRYIW